MNAATWILQAIAAYVFLHAGLSKLFGLPEMISLFEFVGHGQWLRYLTGLLETSGAVLLLIPRYAALGATILAAVMTGAIVTHVLLIGGDPTPAAALLVCCLLIGWVRGFRTREHRTGISPSF